jgi:eukaryotic-like serine/threonine-protein kinase
MSSVPAIGAVVSHYRILEKLGAGGMGVVYKADDLRLKRHVALKFLSEDLARDRASFERFQHEAQAASALNHPNICVTYDFDQADGLHFIAMEWLEGETLAARLAKSALPLDQVFRYATEIADALDKAHQRGIVHRDVKPGNVMITKSGAKLLDFGLAKRVEAAAPVADPPSAMTEAALTMQGVLVGTPEYMAPEQLRGREADARSDIFAFGALLYEMVTARRAFAGKTPADICAAVLDREPAPIAQLTPAIPPALRRLVANCLVKDPDDRWQTAHDAFLELKGIGEAGEQAGVAAAVEDRRRERRLRWVVAGLLVPLAALVTPNMVQWRRLAPDQPVVQFSVQAPDRTMFEHGIAISPDGRRLAFIAGTEGKNALWVRQLDSLEARALPSTEGASLPFWSPDSRVIAFFADGKLRKVDAAGGPPTTVCDASADARGGSWSPEGTIVFSRNFTEPLFAVPASGGSPRAVTALDTGRKETSHRFPQFLPDGRHFVYLARSSAKGNDAVCVGSIDAMDRKVLLASESSAAYGDPGYLLFIRENALVRQAFRPDRLELTGEPRLVAAAVSPSGESGPTGYAPFSVSNNGVLAYRAGAELNVQLAWFDRAGRLIATVISSRPYDDPSLSPDGKRVVVRGADPQTGSHSIWLLDLASGAPTRFTFHDALDTAPLWSPDGNRIVFASNWKGEMDLYSKPASGAGNDEVLLPSTTHTIPDDWSPDGRYLVLVRADPGMKLDLWLWAVADKRPPTTFLQTPSNETHAKFSPDGRWLAYASDESGRAEIYVQPFPPAAGKWQVSTAGGDQPAWRSDGKELFYLAADKKLMAVDVKVAPSFEAGGPRALFQTRVRDNTLTGDRNQYAAAPDGQRFLVVTPVADSGAAPITVVLNWQRGKTP